MSIHRLNGRDHFSSPFNARARLDEIESKICTLKRKIGVDKIIKLALGQFSESPCAQLKNNTIKLPTWFLFRYDDLPQRFRIANLDDPRLEDLNFLEELAQWMNIKFREAGLLSVISPADYGILQRVIKLMRDRDLYEKSKDFTLGHELAHLNYAQVKQQILYSHNIQECVSTTGIIGGILLLFITVSMIPFVHLTITLTVGGIAVTVSILAILARLNKTPPAFPSAKEEEKKPDINVLKALKKEIGGFYFFKTYSKKN